MTTILLTKDEEEHVIGLRPQDQRAWTRFQKKLVAMEAGELVTIQTRFPRNGRFHRLHFSMLGRLFDLQEAFDNDEIMRAWVYIGAGHVHWVPGLDGTLTPVPKSVAYTEADDQEFREVHTNCVKFMRSSRAREQLWPHLDNSASAQMIELVIDGAG